MKNKIVLLTLCAVMAVMAFTGCKNENIEASDTGVTSSAAADDNAAQGEANGTFDIETVRKNIVIKGQPFEVPTVLKDLSDGWTWKENENSKLRDEGLGFAHIYYNEEEVFVAGVENYYEGTEEKGIIYHFTIEADDSSIDGLTPLKSTKQDVIEKYGEPDEVRQMEEPFIDGYYYGIVNGWDTVLGRKNDQSLYCSFTEEGLIKKITKTYVDLEKN